MNQIMMPLLLISYLLTLGGIIVMAISTFGIYRFSNNYTLLHVICLNDMFGVPVSLLGIAGIFYGYGESLQVIKILVLIALLYIANPIGGYIVVKILYYIKKILPHEIKQ